MMSCHRNSPSSPRAPKIQQQSWDDCDSPPIDLYDPCQINPPKSPSRISAKIPPPPLKNPKSPRNFNNSNYYEPRSPSMSARSFNINNDPQRSPKITTTYHAQDDDDDSTSGSSYYQTPTSGSRSPKSGNTSAGGSNFYYESHQSPRRSPNSPRKFVFDAISPSFDQKCKKFEYSEPFSPDDDDDDEDMLNDDGQHSRAGSGIHGPGYITKSSPGHYHSRHDSGKSYTSRTSSGNQQNVGYIQSSMAADIMQQSPGGSNSSGNGGGCNKLNHSNGCDINEQSAGTVNNYLINNGNRYHHQLQHQPMMIQQHQSHQYQHQHQHQHQNQQQQSRHLDEFSTIGPMRNMYLKRDSCMTESTQMSGDSCETTDTALTATTTLSYEPPRIQENNMSGGSINCGGGGGGVGGNISDGNSPFRDEDENLHSGRRGGISRRHAINITSNPGYQVLHSSHSTLDRTCSDSVVSLRCRKSTSDLRSSLDETSNSSGKTSNNTGNNSSSCGGNGQIQTINKPMRRRGSSKSGLAYLASRRSSRDSIKSAVSNTSIFSNEDVGPLAFQSSTRGRQRRTSNFLELPIPDHIRPRVCSLPDRPYNPRVSDDLYRLRHFSISKGTVVNCGDSIISRRSRSNTSVNSTNSRASERSPFEGSCCGGGYANVDSMPPSPSSNDSEPPPPPRYRIVMLGDAGVGKTALVSQFMTSEYMHTYDASLDDEFGEKTVSVLLDDEESELVFIDHPSVEMSVENSLSTYEPHGCVVIYSIVDRNSFRIAEETVNYLWTENMTKEKSVILVGNKADLARARVITTHEGKALAASREVKFIETSSGIQHNVDELLVGVLKQIRLKAKRDKKAESKMKTSRTHMSLHLAKEILQKICLSDITKSKSCENLHVL